MNKEEIFKIIKKNVIEILPKVSEEAITIEKRLKELGANSIDRMEIVMKTMEDVGLKIPLVKLGQVRNIEGLVDVFYENKNKESVLICPKE